MPCPVSPFDFVSITHRPCHLQSDPAPIPLYGTDSLFLGMSSFRNTNQMSSHSWAILTFDCHFLKLLSDLNQVTFCSYLLVLFVVPQECYLNCGWSNENNLFSISLIKTHWLNIDQTSRLCTKHTDFIVNLSAWLLLFAKQRWGTDSLANSFVLCVNFHMTL